MKPFVVILTIVAVIGAMRASRAVTMPLGVALFAVVLAWPLHHRLEKHVPRWLSLSATIAVIFGVAILFVAMIAACANNIAALAPEYEVPLAERIDLARGWAEQYGLSVRSGAFDPGAMIDQTVGLVGTVLNWTYGFLGSLVLITAFLILALLEVRDYRTAMERENTRKTRELLEAIANATHSIRRFVLTRTLTSALTGACTGVYCLAIGLDLALVWAVLAFLLNYIPVIGSIIAVIPPTLLALIHPEAVWVAPAALGGLTVIQFSIGNYLDPRLQGRFLALSPLVLFFSLAFWGWVWGIPGALIGVPITVTLVTVCQHFESTRWIPNLIARRRHPIAPPPGGAPEPQSGQRE